MELPGHSPVNPPPVPAARSVGPPPSLPTPEPPCPLSGADFVLIRQAAVRRKALVSAGRTARASSIITLAIGILGLPLVAMSFSWIAAIVVLGICAVGAVELYGSGRIRRADPAAGRLLAVNQLALLGLILAYCLVQMCTSPLSAELRSQLAGIDLKGIEHLELLLTQAIYGLVAGLSVVFQGGMAFYYFTRRKHVEAFLAQTPDWVRRLLLEIDP